MSDDKSDGKFELKIWEWFSITIPLDYVMKTFRPKQVARNHALVDLSASAVKKIGAGQRPKPEEEAALMAAVSSEARRQENIADRIRGAVEILEEERALPAASPDEEAEPFELRRPAAPWLDRWKAGAGLDSDDHIEVMWSRILAGEIKQPGRFSLQTLAVLPEIDQALAEKFVALSYFMIDGRTVPAWNQFVQYYDAAGIPHEWFLRLGDARLLNFAPIPTAMAGSPPIDFEAAGKVWRINASTFGAHMLTQAGQELASIIERKFQPDHVAAFGAWLKNRYTTVEVADPEGEFHPWEPEPP